MYLYDMKLLDLLNEDYKISAPRLKTINKISKDINKNAGVSGSGKKKSPVTPSTYKKDDDITKERKKKIMSLSKEVEDISRTIKVYKTEIDSLKSIANKTYDEYVDAVIQNQNERGKIYKNRMDAIRILSKIGKLESPKEIKKWKTRYINEINDFELEINKLILKRREIWDELESLEK